MKRTIFAILTMLGVLLPASAQETITGVVVDKKGNPIPGVWIEIPNTDDHTISDLDGTFSITPTNSFSKKLEATYAGMGPKKKKMKDGMRIVMKNYKGRLIPWSWFVEAVVEMPTLNDFDRAPNIPAYGLMAGRVKDWGYYVKGVTNFLKPIDRDVNSYSSGDGFIEKQTYQYWSASAGIIARLGCPLHLYYGLGYASYKYRLKGLNGEWYKVDPNYSDRDKSGLVYDIGLMFRIKRVIISAGTTFLLGYEDVVGAGNIGIGYTF